MYHSTLGPRVTKKKQKYPPEVEIAALSVERIVKMRHIQNVKRKYI